MGLRGVFVAEITGQAPVFFVKRGSVTNDAYSQLSPTPFILKGDGKKRRALCRVLCVYNKSGQLNEIFLPNCIFGSAHSGLCLLFPFIATPDTTKLRRTSKHDNI